jgi:hypothetical protein
LQGKWLLKQKAQVIVFSEFKICNITTVGENLMMAGIWQIAIHTPVWVYLLLIYLIIAGVNASKTRVVKLQHTFIIPAVLTVLSVHTLITTVTALDYLLIIISWISAMIIGVLLAWLHVNHLEIQVNKKDLLIRIPGTWSTMCILMTIFLTKYYFGYEQAINPIVAEQLGFKVSMLAVSGCCTGLFIGRLIGYFRHFKKSADSI